MKDRLSSLGLVLILSALIVSGCGTTKKVDVDVPNVEVDVPNVKVNVDVPNVEVDVPNVKVNVDVPNVEVDVDVPNVEATGVIQGSGNMVIEDRPVSD
jgi:hypothetical protein